MGIFDGLEKFGFGSVNVGNLFEEEKKEEKKVADESSKPKLEELKEEDYLLVKQVKCPVCDNTFKARALKSSKARRIGADRDLRPKFLGVDTIKYDFCSCPKCGYTAMNRYFQHLSTMQIKMLKEKIWDNFKQNNEDLPETYSYDYALDKYKLSLLCTVVKMGKVSEKAYTCLKMSWLCRGKAEELLAQGISEESEVMKACRASEREFYEQAFEGLTKAVSSESFPICGMDQNTMDLLLAEMAFILGKYEVSSKLVSRLLVSQTTKGSIKDKAMDLKEEIVAIMAKNRK